MKMTDRLNKQFRRAYTIRSIMPRIAGKQTRRQCVTFMAKGEINSNGNSAF
jgi:hypothetical protein